MAPLHEMLVLPAYAQHQLKLMLVRVLLLQQVSVVVVVEWTQGLTPFASSHLVMGWALGW